MLLNVDLVNGGSTFIRKEVIERCGLFNEQFFMYNEEIDLSDRVKKAGYTIVVTSETHIWHHHNWTSAKTVSYSRMYYYMMRNRYLYFKNHGYYIQLIIDLFLQFLTFPIKGKWLSRLAGPSLIKYHYLGILRGIAGETGMTTVKFK